MAWIESHQELGAHPKTRKLARLLDISRVTAVGHLQFLWWWAMDYADDGMLGRFDDLDIAVGGEWDGDPKTFVQALTQSGFLIREHNNITINDWHDYAGKLVERRKADAERKRNARRPPDAPPVPTRVDDVSDGRPSDGVRTAYVTQPNPTVPNPTVPNPTPNAPNTGDVVAPETKRSESVLVTLIDAELPETVSDFLAVNQQLTGSWLRQTLADAEVELDGGAVELSGNDVMVSVDAALEAINRALATKNPAYQINNPKAFARSVVIEEIATQLNDVREKRTRPPVPTPPRGAVFGKRTTPPHHPPREPASPTAGEPARSTPP